MSVLERMGGPDAASALPALRAALTDPEARVRQAAAHALGALGPAARAAAEDLGRARTDPNPEVQRAAREALLRILQSDAGIPSAGKLR
jgi:HEAT repeat protein